MCSSATDALCDFVQNELNCCRMCKLGKKSSCPFSWLPHDVVCLSLLLSCWTWSKSRPICSFQSLRTCVFFTSALMCSPPKATAGFTCLWSDCILKSTGGAIPTCRGLWTMPCACCEAQLWYWIKKFIADPLLFSKLESTCHLNTTGFGDKNPSEDTRCTRYWCKHWLGPALIYKHFLILFINPF